MNLRHLNACRRFRYLSDSLSRIDRPCASASELYARILVPEMVLKELQSQSTPQLVRDWMQAPPPWVEVVSVAPATHEEWSISASLDAGERQVILHALRTRADLILMDERAGVGEARRLGLTVTGTLGILAASAERGWISLKPALDQLRQTNFRVHPQLIQDMLQADAERR